MMVLNIGGIKRKILGMSELVIK